MTSKARSVVDVAQARPSPAPGPPAIRHARNRVRDPQQGVAHRGIGPRVVSARTVRWKAVRRLGRSLPRGVEASIVGRTRWPCHQIRPHAQWHLLRHAGRCSKPSDGLRGGAHDGSCGFQSAEPGRVDRTGYITDGCARNGSQRSGDLITPVNAPVPTAAPRGQGMAALAPNGLIDRAQALPASTAAYPSPLGAIGSRVTSGMGSRASPGGIGSRNHRGMDMTAAMGRGQRGYPAHSIAPGIVTAAGRMGGLGNAVSIQHDDGTTARYGHLDSINVREGDRIAVGHPVGTVGNTGNSTGAHLHFEMRDEQGQLMNPATVIDLAQPQAPTPASRAEAVVANSYDQMAATMPAEARGIGGLLSDVAVANNERETQAMEAAMANAGMEGWGQPASRQSARGAETQSMAALNDMQSEMASSRVAQAFAEPSRTAGFSMPSLVSSAHAAPAPAMAMNSPSRPDNQAASGPKGMGGLGGMYVGAVPANAAAALEAETRQAAAMPSARQAEEQSMAALATLAQEQRAPVQAPVMAPALAPAREVATRTVAPVAPMAPAQQVQAPTPNTPVGMNAIAGLFSAPAGSRANSAWGGGQFEALGNGRVGFTNAHGYTRSLSPNDYSFPSTARDPAQQAQDMVDRNVSQARAGFLGIPQTDNRAGNMARGFAGSMAGGVLGSAVAGPLGGLLGAALGKSLAQGQNPFGRDIMGYALGKPVSALGRNEMQGLLANSYTPGLGFPSAPSGVESSWGSPSYGDMASISPGAAAAISGGRGGLY